MDGYQKKKYVCKLLFIFLLGNDIDFGHMEAVNLLSSNRYSEKQIVSSQILCSHSGNCWNCHSLFSRHMRFKLIYRSSTLVCLGLS